MSHGAIHRTGMPSLSGVHVQETWSPPTYPDLECPSS